MRRSHSQRVSRWERGKLWVSRETDAVNAILRSIPINGDNPINIRTGTLLITAAAALAIILLVARVAWALNGNATEALNAPETGSFLHSQVTR